jgi:hypothetical protein
LTKVISPRNSKNSTDFAPVPYFTKASQSKLRFLKRWPDWLLPRLATDRLQAYHSFKNITKTSQKEDFLLMVVASPGSSSPFPPSPIADDVAPDTISVPVLVSASPIPVNMIDDDDDDDPADHDDLDGGDDEFGDGIKEGEGFGDDLDDDDDLDEFDDIDEDDFDDNFDDDFEEELEDDYEIAIDDEISAEFGLNTEEEEEDLDANLDDFDDFENID